MKYMNTIYLQPTCTIFLCYYNVTMYHDCVVYILRREKKNVIRSDKKVCRTIAAAGNVEKNEPYNTEMLHESRYSGFGTRTRRAV